ncbi:MAG: YcgL domain-containing protein [Thiotrichaceae bacterium]
MYRSRRKPGSFLFLPIKDEFNRVPETLLKIFGTPEFSFEFELSPARNLVIKADPQEMLKVIQENGFYLQLPPAEEFKC